VVGEREAFIEIVGDEEDGDADVAADFEDEGAQVGFEGGVEAARRFVEEEDIGLGNEGASDGAALFLAAGELAGVAAGEIGEAEAIEEFGDAAAAFETGEGLRAEGEVLAQGHVGEEGVVLEDVTAGAALGREVDAGFGVKEDAIAEDDAAAVRGDEAGDGIEREGFAGA
jgi:hypothetical protein